MRRYHFTAALVVTLLALFILTACGRGNEPIEASAVPAIRTPIPTFTPTNLPENLRTDSEVSPDTTMVETDAASAQSPVAAVAESSAATMTVSNVSAPAAASNPNQPGVGGPAEAAAVLQPVRGTINIELVNSRTGPDTSHPVVIVLGRGEEYDITGKTADSQWVRICCIEQKEVWMAAEFITAVSSLDTLPVAQAGETSGLTSTVDAAAAGTSAVAPAAVEPAPVAQAAEPAPAEAAPLVPEVQAVAATSAPEAAVAEVASADAAGVSAAAAGGSELQLAAQEQFPEDKVVRVFLFAYQGTEALEGYSLRVEKDGVPQETTAISFGGRPGLTWPIADERQRFQNLKVEFPGVPIGGVWTITPLKDGAAAGPTATFTLAEGDTASELYVRYALP